MRSLSRGNLRAAWKLVRRNRFRSFLTMLGVIIGVASVISVVAIGVGVKHQVTKQINHVGNNLITVRAGQSTGQTSHGLSILSGLNISGDLSAKDTPAIKKALPGATIVPLAMIDGNVTADGAVYHGGPVIATSQDLPSLLNQSTAFGNFFDDGSQENVAVLGPTAALKMFGTTVPLGQSFTFRGQTFTVQAIFNTFGSAPLANDIDFNSAIYIPSSTAAQLTANNALPYEILVKPSATTTVDKTVSLMNQALLKDHGDSTDFSILKTSDQLAATNSTLDLLTQLIAGVAAISLFVGGIGIMNITFVSVTERMHEIGIRKAVGATNRQILEEFMAESVVLSVTGGLIGIVVAGIVDVVLRVLTSLQPVIQWQVVLLATGVSIVIGVLFGTAPALKAARKDPISALRNE